MRMFPPAPILSRYCSEDTTIGEGITVEKVSLSNIYDTITYETFVDK